MGVDWRDILTALALLLVFEGLAPFLNPAGWRQMIARIARLPDAQLRTIGLGVTITGLVLLGAIRSS